MQYFQLSRMGLSLSYQVSFIRENTFFKDVTWFLGHHPFQAVPGTLTLLGDYNRDAHELGRKEKYSSLKCISYILQNDIKVKWQILLETWIHNLNFQDSFQTCIRLQVQWNTLRKYMLLIHERIMQTGVSASKQTFPKLFLPRATINCDFKQFSSFAEGSAVSDWEAADLTIQSHWGWR